MATPRDLDWIQHSFLLAGERVELSADLRQYRSLSSADFKYMSSGLGEDVVINPKPQFTPFADIRRPGLWSGTGTKSPNNISSYFVGMGRAYSSMFHDERQVVHLRMGVTQYKGFLTFFTGFYDHESAILARQGRASMAYYFTFIAGSIATLWLSPFILAGSAVKYLLGRSSSSYMSLKPTMPLFWLRSNTIMNNIGAKLGIIARTFENTGGYKGDVLDADGQSVNTGGASDVTDLRALQQSQNYTEYMSKLLPGIFKKNGQIDLQAVVNRGISKQVEWNDRVAKIADKGLGERSAMDVYKATIAELKKPVTGKNNAPRSMEAYLGEYHKSVVGDLANRNLDSDNVGDMVEGAINSGDANALKQLASDARGSAGQTTDPSLEDAAAGNVVTEGSATDDSRIIGEAAGVNTGMDETLQSEFNRRANAIKEREMLTVVRPKDGVETTDEQKLAQQVDMANSNNQNFFQNKYNVIRGWLSSYSSEAVNEWNRGSAFLNLEVNYTGAGSMTISNSNKETTISGTMKGLSGAARDTRISASDFKTGFDFVDAGMTLVQDLFTGALDSVKMGGLMALAGNAFTNFPKQWDDSSVTVPTASFTIELRSFTGNSIHNYMQLYPTIATLLAAALPLSTGPQSYTAPFVLEAYCRGAFAIRYGMISSLTIRHGVGNLGYSEDRRPLAFDIDVEIADLSSVYHMGISNGANPLNIFKRVFDDDNAFNDYISTITGLSVNDMTDYRRKFSINMATQIANVQSWWSPTHLASRMMDTTPVTALNRIFGPSTFPGM